MINKKIFIIFFFNIIYNTKLLIKQCNLNSFSKKNKIANEIDLFNLISIINKNKLPIYYESNCIAKLPVGNKSNDIFIFFTEKERFFFSLLLTKCKKYLEFGIGGSTLLAYVTPNIKKIIAIDSDIKWINKIKNFKDLKNDIGKRIFLEYINIGNITNWGKPVNNSNNQNFSNYSKQIFKNYENDYDLVLIDGVFRVACVLQVILNCKPDIKIVIHDFNYRPYYHILYKYLDILYSIDSIALFSIKEDINLDDIKYDYELYKNNPK